jgi:hypothetical protein
MNYPLIFKPKKIDDVFSGAYKEEVLKLPEPPKKPSKDDSFGLLPSLIIYLGISVSVLVILGIIINEGKPEYGTAFKIIGGAAATIFVFYIIGTANSNSRLQQYERELHIYNKLENAYLRRKNQVYKIKSDIRYLNKDEEINYFLRYFYSSNTTRAEQSYDNYKEGKQEARLFNDLYNYLEINLHKDKTIIIDNSLNYYDNEDQQLSRLYLPDITYYNPQSGICVDIEIDERYSKETGLIIHSMNDEKDKKRDEFFISHGWFVFRFSEKQIENNNTACVKLILELINKYDPDLNRSEKIETLLNNKNSLPLLVERRW